MEVVTDDKNESRTINVPLYSLSGMKLLAVDQEMPKMLQDPGQEDTVFNRNKVAVIPDHQSPQDGKPSPCSALMLVLIFLVSSGVTLYCYAHIMIADCSSPYGC